MNQLSEYIRKQLQTGVESGHLKDFLISHGYNESDILVVYGSLGANLSLVDYINAQKQRGCPESDIKQKLFTAGYSFQDVNNTFNFLNNLDLVTPPPNKPTISSPTLPVNSPTSPVSSPVTSPKSHPESFAHNKIIPNLKSIILYSSIAVVIVLIIIAGYFYFTRPICGNGVIEEGEDMQTCCQDAGCNGDQTCNEGVCINPICEECQYVKDFKCVDYQCCSDDECKTTEECKNHQCTEVKCGTCQIPMSHECLNLTCCSDTDCDDGNNSTINICWNPGVPESECKVVECSSDSDCDDNDSTTINRCEENKCTYDQITDCINDDGYCPQNCTKLTDNDCINTYNNTNNDGIDKCSSHKECNDSDNSTRDICSGSPNTCKHIPITDCIHDDDYCPPLEVAFCTNVNDNDCAIEMKKCDDFDCFISRTTKCEPASLKNTSVYNDSLLLNTTSYYFEIREDDAYECKLYYEIKNITIDFEPDKIVALNASGLNETQIDELLNETNLDATKIIGSKKECGYNITDLKNILTNWSTANISITDMTC
ncbi:hypothetical protein K9M79_00950 [Candidatus Woesearchaeota archaeon]|nr:hypothetical protein [Candidatus Woesearchaeota archaeon]